METFNMYGVESMHCPYKKHEHKDGDECHRCKSTNTEIESDCVTGSMYWVWLQCRDCNLGMIFEGGRED